VRYYAPDEKVVLNEPTPQVLEQVLCGSSPDYWQQGGNGEAVLDAGPKWGFVIMGRRGSVRAQGWPWLTRRFALPESCKTV